MTDEHLFRMSLNMSVLEALGINLYSNAAAVLSELVANAWDADANEVHIHWDRAADLIEIVDDGRGMSVTDLNDKFLTVGYQKRANEGDVSPKFGRKFMGRKGIGKLSVFSIANTVRLFSDNGQSRLGLEIDVPGLMHHIQSGTSEPYFPAEIAVPSTVPTPGTVLSLSSLRRNRTDLTITALRKRLARRFDVLDMDLQDETGFAIYLGDEPITYEDRQDLKTIEYLWEFGDSQIPNSAVPNVVTRFRLPNVVNSESGWYVNGWFGSATRPSDLTQDEESGPLKNLMVLARRRPIQEGILEKLNFSQIFASYLTGQVRADFLDDGPEDIATSDRQRLIEDDPRVTALQGFLRRSLLLASDQWSEARPKKRAEVVQERHPTIRNWIQGLPDWQREPAKTMIGTIEGLELSGNRERQDTQRVDLFRSGILAFERIGLRESVRDLHAIEGLEVEQLLASLAQQDAYEAALYSDILRSRIEAISAFQSLTGSNEKERVLQQHLFEHLYLLDATWERAGEDPTMEEDLRRIAPNEFDLHGVELEQRGRVDIRYRVDSGKHIIVELKRYEREVTLHELIDQGNKYGRAMTEILKQAQQDFRNIEIVFVLGKAPRVVDRPIAYESDGDYIDSQLSGIRARYVSYDNLIRNALRQYRAYIEARDKSSALESMLREIELPARDDTVVIGPADVLF